MPIYEYACEDCRHLFEEWQKDFTEKEMTCPVCGGRAKRMISNTAFILKGSGWYATDYARGNESASSNGGNGNGGQTADTDSTSASSTTESSTGTTSSAEGSKTACTQDS